MQIFNRKSIYRNDLYSFLFFCLFSIFFFAFYQWFLFYTDLNIVQRLKSGDKIVSMFHVIAIVLVALLFLIKKIDHDQFSFFITISRGYLVYDTILMAALWYLKGAEWAKRLTFILHHIIFLWITYQIDRYPRLIAQGLLAEIYKIPYYILWYICSFTMKNSLLYIIFLIITVIVMFIAKIVNFTVIGMLTWKDQTVSRLEFTFFVILVVGNYLSFASLLYSCQPA